VGRTPTGSGLTGTSTSFLFNKVSNTKTKALLPSANNDEEDASQRYWYCQPVAMQPTGSGLMGTGTSFLFDEVSNTKAKALLLSANDEEDDSSQWYWYCQPVGMTTTGSGLTNDNESGRRKMLANDTGITHLGV
jgi:hypothetical protein